MKSSIESYIASKDPGKRSKDNLYSLLPWFRRYGKNVLKDATDEILVEILQNCTFERFQKDEIIISEGDIGDCFYILIEGKVKVYVRDIDTTSEDLKKRRVSINNKGYRNILGECVLTEGKGYSFGEYALMEEDRVRTASVKAAEDCSVIVVNIITYNNSLKNLQNNILMERDEFVKNKNLFRDFNLYIKKLIKMSLKKVVFPFESNIVTQGEKSIGLIFITRGSGQLHIDAKKHETQYPELFPLDFSLYTQQYQELPKMKSSVLMTDLTAEESAEHLTSRMINLKRKKGYAALENYIQHNNAKLCSVQSGEIIGDLELLYKLKTNLYSITCLEETEAFILETIHIDRIIRNSNPNSFFERLKKIIRSKLENREKYFIKVPIPLMLFLKMKLYFKTIEFSKEYPKMITTKELPSTEEEWQHLLKMFEENKAPLFLPYIRGSVYLKDLMKKNAYGRQKDKNNKRNAEIQFTGSALDTFPIGQDSIYKLQRMSRNPVHMIELIQKEIIKQRDGRPKILFHVLSRINTEISNENHDIGTHMNSTVSVPSFLKTKTTSHHPLTNQIFMKTEFDEANNLLSSTKSISTLQNSQIIFLNTLCSEQSKYEMECNKSKYTKGERQQIHFLPSLPCPINMISKDIPKKGAKVLVKQRPCEEMTSPYKFLKHSHYTHKVIDKIESIRLQESKNLSRNCEI